MAETLSEQERAEYQEEVDHHDKHHPNERGYQNNNGGTYEQDQDGSKHVKSRDRKSQRLSDYEREEMEEEVEYHEKTHPRGKTPKERVGPEEHPETMQPGHGGSRFLSPFEISEYKEELDYREKQHSTKKQKEPLSASEMMGFESAWNLTGNKGGSKKMPEGMMGYDIEVDYFHDVSQKDNRRINPRGTRMFPEPFGPQKSRGRKVTDAIRGGFDFALEARDNIYGYRRIYDHPETSNAWHLDNRSVRRNRVGTQPMFSDRAGGRLMGMDPFGIGGHTTTRGGKKSRSKKSRGGSSHGDIPPSLAWMF